MWLSKPACREGGNLTGCVISKKTSAGKEYLYINLKYKDPENGTWKNKMISTKMLAKGNKRRAKQLIPGLIEEYAYLEAVIQRVQLCLAIRENRECTKCNK